MSLYQISDDATDITLLILNVESARQNEVYKQQRIKSDIDILAQKSRKKSNKKKKRLLKLNTK